MKPQAILDTAFDLELCRSCSLLQECLCLISLDCVPILHSGLMQGVLQPSGGAFHWAQRSSVRRRGRKLHLREGPFDGACLGPNPIYRPFYTVIFVKGFKY